MRVYLAAPMATLLHCGFVFLTIRCAAFADSMLPLAGLCATCVLQAI